MIAKQQNQNMAILNDEINCTSDTMNELPTNLSLEKRDCDNLNEGQVISENVNTSNMKSNESSECEKDTNDFTNETRIHLSFSVDRLLNDSINQSDTSSKLLDNDKCCDESNNGYSCCSLPNCYISNVSSTSFSSNSFQSVNNDITMQLGHAPHLMDPKFIVRPTPVRAVGNNTDQVTTISHFTSLAPNSLVRFHHAQIQQKQVHQHLAAHPGFVLSSLMHPMCGIKTPNDQQIGLHNFQSPNRFSTKSTLPFDIPVVRPNLTCISNLRHHHMPPTSTSESHLNFSNTNNSSATASSQSGSSSVNNTPSQHTTLSNGKRKRSWSRAVFSNLQRKGLEIQFQQQKYITKPDRRKLAARLNLTDAQVKVWFQNRRMKWRHTRENLKSGQEKQPSSESNNPQASAMKAIPECGDSHSGPGYSSDGSSSIEMSEGEDDDDEIDVVE